MSDVKNRKSWVFNRKMFIFLAGVFCYTILFNLIQYSHLYGFNIFYIDLITVFFLIILSPIPMFILYKPRFMVIPMFILGFIFSFLSNLLFDDFMNIARLQFTPKVDLPTYGNYIYWGGSGFIGSSSEYYLVNMKKDDPVITNKLSEELGLQNPHITFNIRHIVDDYSLLSMDY